MKTNLEGKKIFWTNTGIIPENKNYYSEISPIDFVAILKQNYDKKDLRIINQPPKNWIKDSHIPELIKLIDSDEPAANVCDIKSPVAPNIHSTVGIEAMLLIDAFRTGSYHHTCSNIAKRRVNPEETKLWYEHWKKNK